MREIRQGNNGFFVDDYAVKNPRDNISHWVLSTRPSPSSAAKARLAGCWPENMAEAVLTLQKRYAARLFFTDRSFEVRGLRDWCWLNLGSGVNHIDANSWRRCVSAGVLGMIGDHVLPEPGKTMPYAEGLHRVKLPAVVVIERAWISELAQLLCAQVKSA